MTKKELELAGAIMYKCEGSRPRHNKPHSNTIYYGIEFTNSDPVLIQIFLKFLRGIIKIEERRLKCELFIYSDLEKEKIENFWSLITKIPLNRFHKTIVYQAKNPKYKPNLLGTCKIRYINKEAYLKLNEIIKKKLGQEAGFRLIK